MKKTLLIFLAVALVLSLCAGCNNGKRVVDDDFDDDPEPIVIGDTSGDNSGDKPDDNPKADEDKPKGDSPAEWPTELPPYPDGKITRFEPGEYDKYGITIVDTSRATVEAYAETLSNAGWECVRNNEDNSKFALIYNKEDRSISLLLLEDGTTLLLNLYRVLDKEELENAWPVDYLPQGFPEYPDGDIVRVRVDESGSVYINIEESSIGTFDKYAATLKDAGWDLEEAGTDNMMVWYIEKGNEYFGTIACYIPDGSIDITVY